MNKSKVIWGVVCLAVAILLVVLIVAVPQAEVSFMVNDVNRPYIPVIIVAIIGIALVTSAREPEEPKEEPPIDPDKAALNKRLETIAWGLFLIMLGGFLFVSRDAVTGGWWSIGVGLIMLGLNAARYLNGLKMSGGTTVLGIIALIGGVLDLVGVTQIEGPLLLIVLGVYLVLKDRIDKQQLFGKAET